MPCPLCLLGFPQPHSKADWEEFRNSQELRDKLNEIRKPIREAQRKRLLETGEQLYG